MSKESQKPGKKAPKKPGFQKNGDFVTGTGQLLTKIHPKDKCTGTHCVIHNPSDHPMRDFPTHWREDRGIMERICPCGIGHPDADSPWDEDSGEWVHGCGMGCHVEGWCEEIKRLREIDSQLQ